MAEVDDPGKLLFSFDVKDRSKIEYNRMGRSIQLRNSKKYLMYSAAGVVVCIGLSIAISTKILVIALAVAIQAAVFIELSSRNIASKIQARAPLHYDYYEDGLTETVNGETKLTWYNEIRHINVSKYLYTVVCKKDIFVIPRDVLNDESEGLVKKLISLVAVRKKNRHHKKKE